MGDAFALRPEMLEGPLEALAALHPSHIVPQGGERRPHVVDPGPVGVAVARARRVVEPRVLDALELGQPLLALARAAEGRHDGLGILLGPDDVSDPELHRTHRQVAQLLVGPIEDHVDAGHHARHEVVGDGREVRTAKLEEGEVGPIGEIEHLEVVVGHLVHVLEQPAVVHQEIEGGRGAAPTKHRLVGLALLEGFEVHRLEAVDAVRGLVDPLVVDLVPVLEVVAGTLLEDRLALGDHRRVVDDVGAEVQVAVHDAVLDPEGGGEAPDPCRVLVERDEPALRHHQVERVQRLRVVHLVEEPELVLVAVPHVPAEEEVVGVHRLPPLRAGRRFDVVWVAKRPAAHGAARPSASRARPPRSGADDPVTHPCRCLPPGRARMRSLREHGKPIVPPSGTLDRRAEQLRIVPGERLLTPGDDPQR